MRYIVYFLLWVVCTCYSVAQTPTYSEHVAPIIFKNCVSCHRTGEIAPFPLTNYSETVKKAQTIRYTVERGYMPPWKAAKNYGHFLDERALTADEKQTLLSWIDNGTPEGDVSKMPSLPTFPEGSLLGTPDLVLRIPVKFKITGNNQDVYRNFVVPTGLTENKNIAAIEVRPDNKKIVHHVLLWNDNTGAARNRDAQDSEVGYEEFGGPGIDNPVATYPGWAPGGMPRMYPPGIGLKMYKNSDLIIQMHYAPTSTDEEDQTTINIFFKKETNTREILEASILPDQLTGGYNAFVMPANKVSTFKGTLNVTQDVSVSGVFPHMHKLGANAKLYAVTPAKDTLKLINIPTWDFNWQGTYNYKNLQKIPRGSKVYYEATYDNTENNPNNPNIPPKTMSWGFKTSEEMYLCYVFFMPYKTGDENISQETTTDVEDQPLQEKSDIDIKGISPNPASEQAILEFTMLKERSLSISVCDITGTTVDVISSNRIMPVGAHKEALNIQTLPSGVYICLVKINGNSVSIPFTVVR